MSCIVTFDDSVLKPNYLTVFRVKSLGITQVSRFMIQMLNFRMLMYSLNVASCFCMYIPPPHKKNLAKTSAKECIENDPMCYTIFDTISILSSFLVYKDFTNKV